MVFFESNSLINDFCVRGAEAHVLRLTASLVSLRFIPKFRTQVLGFSVNLVCVLLVWTATWRNWIAGQPGRHEALARTVSGLLGDPAGATRIGERVRTLYCEHYTIQKHVAAIECEYLALIEVLGRIRLPYIQQQDVYRREKVQDPHHNQRAYVQLSG